MRIEALEDEDQVYNVETPEDCEEMGVPSGRPLSWGM